MGILRDMGNTVEVGFFSLPISYYTRTLKEEANFHRPIATTKADEEKWLEPKGQAGVSFSSSRIVVNFGRYGFEVPEYILCECGRMAKG